MPINHDEIIKEIERHIRKLGGEHSEWCVGTAKDARAPFFRRHLAADLGDGLIYREAFTTTAADEVIDHLVHACGLRLAPEAQRPSTAHEAEGSSALHDALEPGRIVFVFRPTAGEKAEGSVQWAESGRQWAQGSGRYAVGRRQ
jgi:hypothetical protein